MLAVGRRFAEKEIQELGRAGLGRPGSAAGCGHQDAAELLQSGELGSAKEVEDGFSGRIGDGEIELRKSGRARGGGRGRPGEAEAPVAGRSNRSRARWRELEGSGGRCMRFAPPNYIRENDILTEMLSSEACTAPDFGVDMKTFAQFHEQAEFLRESSGSNIEKTLIKAVKVLALFDIPHYVCGGFAVQEHGYPRFTVDVDIIVPDVEFAREKLRMNGFKEKPVEIDLLPGGGKVDPGPLTLPVPSQVSDQPQVLALPSLVSSKLSTYIGRGIQRIQDYADVAKLVEANHLPRDYGVDPKVRDLYHNIWDELHGQRGS